MERTQIYLTSVQRKKLREKSNESGLPLSEIIRRAIDHYFELREYRKEK